MVVYKTQNYWVFGFCPSSGILKKLENTVFRKLELFLSSGEGGDTPLGPLQRANLNNLCQYNYSYINTRDQALSMEDNRKNV
jgi:hypothetical protein